MSNGTSLSFLVYMIYNKSIWKYKGEESGYMERAMEKIKNMKNGTASEKQYRVRRCRYTDLAMVLVIAVSIQCFTRLEYAGERYMQSRNGYKIAGGIMEGCGRKNVKGYVEIKASCVSNAKNIIENLCAQVAAPNRTIMNVTTSTADAGKDDSRITKLPAAEEMNTSASEDGTEILKAEKNADAALVAADTTTAEAAVESAEEDKSSTEEQQSGMLNLDGFIIGENGMIERCENPSLAAEDGIIILPSDDRCKGIGAERKGMNIRQITDGKEDYIELLRMGDPDESRIRKVLEEGELFLLEEHGKLRTLCVVIFSEEKKCEIKNIVTIEKDRGKGYGRYMIHYICEHYCSQYDWGYMKKDRCRDIMEFCEKCGFTDEDEVYLKKELMSEIDTKRVINLAMEAGRMLLKNGGEIFRVEETMMRICRRFGVKYVELFTLSHGLFICAGTDKEKLYTKVKQVPLSSTHLGIVAEVNDLSREIAAGHVGIEEAIKKLKKIDKMPVKRIPYQIAAAGLSAGGLGYLLGGTSREAFVAFFVGCVVFSWSLFAGKHGVSKILIHIVGGIIIASMALAAMQIPFLGELRMEGIVTGGIMPLVPGLAFVNAIRDLADSDYLAGTVKMIDAVMVFVYIAIGVGTALSVYHHVLGGIL